MDVVEKLVDIVERLYNESEGYLDNPAEVQLWYNRGYANGVIKALIEAGHGAILEQRLKVDAADLHGDNTVMEWTKAYHHGMEMGEREAKEVMPQQ